MLDLNHHDLLREVRTNSSMKMNDLAFDNYASIKAYIDRHRGRKNYQGEKTKKIAYYTYVVEKKESINLTYFDNTICKFFPNYNQYFSTYYSNHNSTNRRLFATGLVTGKKKLHIYSPISAINLCKHLMNSKLRVLEEGTIISTRLEGASEENKVIITDDDLHKLREYVIEKYLFTKSSVNKHFSLKEKSGFDISILVRRDEHNTLNWAATFGLFEQINLLRTKPETIDVINDIVKNSTLSQDRMNYGIIDLDTALTVKDYLSKFKARVVI